MDKKLLISVRAICLVVPACFVAAACGSSVEQSATSTSSSSASTSKSASTGTASSSGGSGGSGGVGVTTGGGSGGIGTSVATGSEVGGTSAGSGGLGGGVTTGGGFGGGSVTSGGGAGGEPNCPPGPDACTECLSPSCSQEYCSCYGNISCSELFQCLEGCNAQQDCKQKCYTANEDGISAAALLSSCAATSCSAQCPGNKQLDACDTCLFTQCSIQMNHCVANADCVALFACADMCMKGDQTCVSACEMQYPNGLSDAQSATQCEMATCSAACK